MEPSKLHQAVGTRRPGEASLLCSFCGKAGQEAREFLWGPALCVCDQCLRSGPEPQKRENRERSGFHAGSVA